MISSLVLLVQHCFLTAASEKLNPSITQGSYPRAIYDILYMSRKRRLKNDKSLPKYCAQNHKIRENFILQGTPGDI